eukprot:TRINITY_DN9985_c0_g3_i1.p1 TRINITY_DN9985_c0_g3~~TRINITY_DN9985_c0_g3_i1.p1  ORF type:complete len:170 (+),score=15.45 TRINITY_DN9985_c0_g3_i1:289-798(+)
MLMHLRDRCRAMDQQCANRDENNYDYVKDPYADFSGLGITREEIDRELEPWKKDGGPISKEFKLSVHANIVESRYNVWSRNIYSGLEIAYDIVQFLAIFWIIDGGHVKLDSDHFPGKLLADFANILTTSLDILVLKGPSAAKKFLTAGEFSYSGAVQGLTAERGRPPRK